MANATTEGVRALGALIKDRRGEMDLTLEQVAERAGLSIGYLGNIEKGYINPKRGPVVPSDASLRAISAALEIPLEYLHRALGRLPEMETEIDPDFQVIVEAYEGADADGRATLKQIAEQQRRLNSALAASRAGALGRRTDD